MKYLKSFETLNIAEIGDYVIARTSNTHIEDFVDFINNNFGRIIDIENDYIQIEFKNIPDKLEYFFDGFYGNRRTFTNDKIVKLFKNKKDAEIYLTANKYNL